MLPILYSFRRCPYAMRARLALSYALEVNALELREVILKNKPQALLDISPKATVPVLQLVDGTVIDESLDIMKWALSLNDPDDWLNTDNESEISELITQNDGEFKWALDHYKYSDRHEESEEYYRAQGETFLHNLNERLKNNAFLMGENISFADLAIFPFIRQFAHVDKNWFFASEYKALINWTNYRLESELFKNIMKKNPGWQEGDEPLLFPY